MARSVRGPRWWWFPAVVLAVAPLLETPASAAGIDLRAAAVAGDWKQVQALGPGVLPSLARLYASSSEKEKATIAYVFYQLGWKSPEAKRALMADVHTQDQALRLQVQVLRSPQRVARIAQAELHMIEPAPSDAIVIQRAVPAEPPAKSVVALR